MSEPINATIRIGGVIPAKAVDGLLKILCRNSIAEIMTILDGDGHYVISATPNHGEFTEIEEYCQANDISYDRESEAKDEYDGEVVCNRPSLLKSLHYCFPADQNGDILVHRDLLLPVLENIEHAREATDYRVFLERAYVELKRILCPELTELPPLTIEKADAAS